MDYTNLTVVQLKQLLRDRDLPVSGIKSVLINRLLINDTCDASLPLSSQNDYPNFTVKELKLLSPQFLTGVIDADRKILLNLDGESLYNVCIVNRYTRDLCDDDFWNMKLEREYNRLYGGKEKWDLYRYKDKKTYEEIYRELDEEKTPDDKLIWASAGGYLPIVKYLIEKGRDGPTL